MADYISALNGEQMDSALMDVALRNPEAWAVGQRNGVPVTSADETYHNNAKYYAQVAQSAIPGTYTAAVRWDIAQGLAGEAQEQARANISAGASNRNLLDNPWFTVNQRNITSITVGTAKTYTLDRWYAFRAAITALSGGGITFAWNGTDLTSGLLSQGTAYDLRDETLTMSAIINGTVRSWTTTFTGTAVSYTFSGLNIRFQLDQAGTNTYAQIFIETATPVTISAVKLELGSYSTLANDVPPDYGEELRKCQYYFRRVQGDVYLCSGMIINASSVVFPFPFVMYKNPNVSTTGVISCVSNGGVLSITAIQSVGRATNAIQVRFTTSGATPYAAALLTPQNGGYIDFSADL